MPSATGSSANSRARSRRPAARVTGRVLLVVAAGVLAACIVVPRTTEVYDEGCRIVARQMVLEVEQVATIAGCANQGCVAMLAAAGVVTAASAVISGSIVVAGNIAYWFERRGQCLRSD